ncbi:2-amino-4-hydroxy-6-hydroxymethyldihydropteridine diphosphokinase [Sulfurisphaera ohwakuensis]|uniref:2-amino-4-hydroxy-6- hydroxymethyldihydropteridine diphosphokinase n=1 Tax=Sulfurisphaera ohwakuensis TaxID=69656 RepID=UPI0036F20731
MKILIEDLRVNTIIGVNPNERTNKQEVSIDLEIWTDLQEGVKSYRISDTIDYKVIKKEIISYVENSSFNLLETLAYKICKVVLQDNRIKKVRVRVNKPGALSYAKNVAVEISMMRKNSLAKAYIGIGSNIEPEVNVRRSLMLLKEKFKVTKISTVYLTKAIPPNQPDYYNCVVEIKTNYDPFHVKYILRKIEDKLGRVRNENKYSPRTIDLDLLMYGNLIINSEDLVLPDPEITQRPFISIPLYELNEDLVIPGVNKAIKEIVKDVKGDEMKPLNAYTEELKRELFGI